MLLNVSYVMTRKRVNTQKRTSLERESGVNNDEYVIYVIRNRGKEDRGTATCKHAVLHTQCIENKF